MEEQSGTREDEIGTNDLSNTNGVAQGVGKIGNAADFGTSTVPGRRLVAGSNLGIGQSSAFSISFWMKVNTEVTSSGDYRLFDVQKGTGQGYELIDYVYNGGARKLRVETVTPIDYTLTAGTSSWYHIVYTKAYGTTGSTALYVNGELGGTGSGTYYGGAGSSFQIGGGSSSSGENGPSSATKIDEVGLWNRALSAVEVASLYAIGTGGSASGGSLTAVRKNTNESVSSSSVLQDDDELSLALASSTDYVVEAFIVASTSSKTPDFKFGFVAPTGSEMLLGYLANNGLALAGGGIVEASGVESDKILLSTNGSTMIHVTGTIKTGTEGGTYTLRWAQSVNDSGGVTVRKGSYLRVNAI